jgi:hypothetical protein
VNGLDGVDPFPDDCFQRVGWPNQTTARISNTEGSLVLDCTVDGIVLTLKLEDLSLPFDQIRAMFRRLALGVLPIYGGDDLINRIGIVEQYKFPHEAPAKVAVDSITQLGQIGTPGDIKLRAAFRRPTERAVTMRRVEDWRNTIVEVGSFKESDESASDGHDTLRVNIDHQIYFIPERRLEAALIDQHYTDTVEQRAALQETYLAGLASADVVDAR